jgi:hypothetical protein
MTDTKLSRRRSLAELQMRVREAYASAVRCYLEGIGERK